MQFKSAINKRFLILTRWVLQAKLDFWRHEVSCKEKLNSDRLGCKKICLVSFFWWSYVVIKMVHWILSSRMGLTLMWTCGDETVFGGKRREGVGMGEGRQIWTAMKIYKNKLSSSGVHFSFFNRRLGSDGDGRSYVKQVLFHFMFELFKLTSSILPNLLK